jgi:hypothetical protein
MTDIINDYPYVWRSKVTNPERFGQRCRIVQILAPSAYHVEFEDGAVIFAIHNWFKRVA